MTQIELTESAAYEVKDMLEKNEMPEGFLRFKVQGGGCTGLTYGMAAEIEKSENDEEYEFHGVKVLVDKHDSPVIDGTVIDLSSRSWAAVLRSIIQMHRYHAGAAHHSERRQMQELREIVN